VAHTNSNIWSLIVNYVSEGVFFKLENTNKAEVNINEDNEDNKIQDRL
jgi:hypothetical protein